MFTNLVTLSRFMKFRIIYAVCPGEALRGLQLELCGYVTHANDTVIRIPVPHGSREHRW